MSSDLSTRPVAHADDYVRHRPTQDRAVAGPVLPAAVVTRPNVIRTTRTRTGGLMKLRMLAVALAVLGSIAIVAIWQFFVATRSGQLVENLAYAGALTGRNRLWTLAEPVLDVVSMSFVVLGTGTAVGIALIRRRWMLAFQVFVVVAGANLSTQALKHLVFDRPALGAEHWWSNSLPSGHTTVAASVSIALLLALPRAARPAIAVFGAGYTAATGISTLVGRWHRPSDVVAALLVVLVWGALACAVTTRSEHDPMQAGTGSTALGRGTVRVLAFFAVVAVGAGGAAVWALDRSMAVVASGESADHAAGALAYAGGATAVVAFTALVFALLLALRQAVARPVPSTIGANPV